MTDEQLNPAHESPGSAVTFSLASSDIQHAKRAMAAEIMKTLDVRQWSTRRAEQETGVNHADFTRIRRANVSRYSLERLIAILKALGHNVELAVNVRPGSSGILHSSRKTVA